MKVLVTGAAGLIGFSLCERLHKEGYSVTAVDNFSRGSQKPICDYFIEQDIQSANLDTDYDVIYHMSATNGTPSFYEYPGETLINNFTGDLAVYNLAKQCLQLKKFVYASTSEIVHNSPQVPTPEIKTVSFDNVHNPRWSYTLPKLAMENLIVNSDLPWLVVRYFNVYGANSKKGHFVADQIEKLKKDQFEIVGLNETRSFCYIDDAIDATLKLSKIKGTRIVNVGNDEELRIADACTIIANALGKTVPAWKNLPSRTDSAQRRCPNLTLLKQLVPDYNPRSFEQGIKNLL